MYHQGHCVIIISAAKYKHVIVKRCCYDGARHNDVESCEQRAARITLGQRCITAFKECCALAEQFRAELSLKPLQLGRLSKFDVFYQNCAQYEEFLCNTVLLRKVMFVLYLKLGVEKITCKCP